MANIATLGVEFDTRSVRKADRDLDGFTKGATKAERSNEKLTAAQRKGRIATDRYSKSVNGMSGSLGGARSAMLSLAPAIAGLLTFAGAAIGMRKFVQNTIEAESSLRQLQAVLASTGGASGQTVESLQKMASAMQDFTTYGDEAIQVAQGILLTFTKIGGEKFQMATEAVLNVATAMKTDLKSAAIQVGKALNDPVLGITALSRSGITFSEGQKAVVKQLVETGQTAKAQALILKELETQFGGSARAARQTLGGALTSLAGAWGDLFEVSSGASNSLRMSIEGLITAIRTPDFARFVEMVGVGLFNALTIAARAVGVVTTHLGDLFDILKIIVAAKTVTWITTLGASFLNLAIIIRKVGMVTALFSRIGKVNIVMMTALAAIVAKATGYYEGFEKGLKSVFDTAKNLLPDSLANGIDETIDSLTGFNLESEALANNMIALQGNALGLADSFGALPSASASAGSALSLMGSNTNAVSAKVSEGVNIARDAVGGFVTDLKSGLQSGEGMWSAFASAALNALDKITNRLLDMALDGLFSGGGGGGIGGLLSGLFGGGGSSAASGMTLGAVYHNGGVAGSPGSEKRSVPTSAFAGAPRYHGGGVAGLKPNEVPAILERGERIIPNGGGGGGQTMHITLGVSVDKDGTIKPFVENVAANVSVAVVQQATPSIVNQSSSKVGADLAGGAYDKSMGRYNARPRAIPR